MIGLASDKDNSYFLVQTQDANVQNAILDTDVLELTITEECEKMTTGTLRLRDQSDSYSKILRRNQPITISWGYKKAGESILSLATNIGLKDSANMLLDAFGKQIDRRGMRAIIMNPSGEANDKGEKFYNASFLCYDQRGLDESKVWEKMSRRMVILHVVQSLGINYQDIDIGFIDDGAQVGGERQDETAFRYLCRKSQEWHAIFRIGYDPTGVLCAIFVSADRLANSQVAKRMAGGALDLRYASGPDANVLSYSWQNNEGENGQGDNVRLELVNGQYMYTFVTVKDEKVVTWQLSMDAVQAEFAKRPYFLQQAAYVGSVMDYKTFQQIKYLFRPVVQSTAPNGFGYTVNVRMFGTPFAAPPCQVSFTAGFPSLFQSQPTNITSRQNLFYLRRVTHSLNASGWFADMEIVDGYLMYGAIGIQ
jgi:hypothetical protein